MNRAITRLFALLVVLFGLLVAFTSRWTVFSATALDKNPLNKLSIYASWEVKRGQILADNGQVLARSVPARGGLWSRSYPFGSLFSQTVGYSNIQFNQAAGLESTYASQLAGTVHSNVSSVFGPLSRSTKGNDLYTTLDPKLQQLARKLLAGRVGSVVAIVPQTGAIKVMYSNPVNNPNNPFACKLVIDNVGCQENLATQGQLPPGSTFKIVTTTAALNTGKFTPQSLLRGPSPLIVSGRPLHNDGDVSYGPTSLTKALTYSINTIYAQVGQRVGPALMSEYMKRFGFYSTPPLDYPAQQMMASGERLNGKLILPTSPYVDIGRMSIGQDKLTVTPLQMAMVVATVANGGTLMAPRLATKVVNPLGQVVESFPPKVYNHVMAPRIAAEIGQMMTKVVEEGTGQAANLQGLYAAGKTGTAQTGGYKNGLELDDAWFVGFPVKDPQIAVAVTLENIQLGYGGTYAAPIAAQIMKAYLAELK